MQLNKSHGPGSSKSRGAWFLGLCIVCFVGIMMAWPLLPLDRWLSGFSGWVQGFGVWGVVVVCLAYTAGAILLIPSVPMTLAVSLAYGWWALPICMGCGLLAALVSFLLGRYVARDLVQKYVQRHPALRAIDAVAKEESFKTILLARLTPVTPFSVENYVFGTTSVRLLPFMVGTAVGIIPGSVLNVWVGVLGQAAAEGNTGTANYVLLGLGLVATATLVIWMTRRAKQKLADERAEAAAVGAAAE